MSDSVSAPAAKRPYASSSDSAEAQLPPHSNSVSSVADQSNPFPFTRRVTNQQLTTSLRNMVHKHMYPSSSGAGSSHLPSPLPHTMSRAAIPAIGEGYWVCEKTDGQRALFFVTPDAAYFIDRTFSFFEVIDPSNVLVTALGKSSTGVDAAAFPSAAGPIGTLLDGELIRNVSAALEAFDLEPGADLKPVTDAATATGPWLFCVFDAVSLRGVNVSSEPLIKRLGHLGTARDAVDMGRERAEEAAAEAARATATDSASAEAAAEAAKEAVRAVVPFRMVTKTFLPAYKANEVTGSIRKLPGPGGHYVFVNRRKGVATFNDGLIFTPNQNNYLMTRADGMPIYKWKWPGMNTVDFLLQPPWFNSKNELMLGMNASPFPGSGRPLVVASRTIRFTAEGKARFLASFGSLPRLVVECGYNTHSSTWEIKGTRADKQEPNHCNTVFSCLEAAADNLTDKDLSGALLRFKDAWKRANEPGRG